MCQLVFKFNEQLILDLACRPKMKWQWILKMAARGWIDEYTSDHAAKLKRQVENA